MSLPRPTTLFDRTAEWDELSRFVTSPTPGLRIGLVSGRRRYGKTFLLRRLAEAYDGTSLVHQGRELDRHRALETFADDVADALGLDPDSTRFDSWETALRTALGMPRRRAPGAAAPRGVDLLVLDELPYLIAGAPELPSVLQLLYDEAQDEPQARPATLVLCGSALSVMASLQTGDAPLRGRAQVDMTLEAFDHVVAREFWQVEDVEVAFHVDAVLGGTPGYRRLVTTPPPDHVDALPAWLGATVLNPASALFSEKAVLLREDPRMTDRLLYGTVLDAVARGHRTPRAIGAELGRDYNQLRHPLGVLEQAGFLVRVDDVLTRRRPVYTLADPIVRFADVVIDPYRDLLEDRQFTTAWELALPAFRSLVLGPHLERMARTWLSRYSGDRWGVRLGAVGPAVVNDVARRAQREIDLVALERGVPRFEPGVPIAVLGEAKATARQRGLADLVRLEQTRDLLGSRGYDVDGTRLLLVSRTGFDDDLRARAQDGAVTLVDLPTLYARG